MLLKLTLRNSKRSKDLVQPHQRANFGSTCTINHYHILEFITFFMHTKHTTLGYHEYNFFNAVKYNLPSQYMIESGQGGVHAYCTMMYETLTTICVTVW